MQLKSQNGIECPTRKDVPVLVKICARLEGSCLIVFLCMFVYSGVQHFAVSRRFSFLCCVVFCCFLFLYSSRVLWTQWYLFLWIVHY
jgi:hypothetical protein